MKIKISFDLKQLKINRTIRFLISADLLLFSGWGLIGPIFALFVVQRVADAGIVAVGAAAGVYWVVKSLVQLPVAVFIDKHEGEKDDFHVLLLSLLLAGFTAMAFLLVETVTGLLAVAFLQGVAFGLYTPSWSAMFSRHLDKEHYAFDWSLDSTTVGLASGATAFIGAAIARFLGFESVFVLASILAFGSAALLFFVPNLIFPKPGSRAKLHYPAKPVSGATLIRDHLPVDPGSRNST